MDNTTNANESHNNNNNIEDPTVVIDAGSYSFKSGMSGEFVPKTVFQSVLGTPKVTGPHGGMHEKATYVGDEALTKRLVLNLGWPIKKGRITDLDDMELLLKFAYDELKIAPEEHRALFSEGSFIPQDQRVKLAELVFETFNHSGFFVAHEAVLATYGSGRTTALVIDFGADKTDIIPVNEASSHSIPILDAITRLNVGGNQLTKFMVDELPQSGYEFKSRAEEQIVNDIKEETCYVSYNPEKELADPKPYTLPDGQVINITLPRFTVPECYFRPDMIGMEDTHGLQQQISNSLSVKNSQDMLFLRKRFAENCLITGGGSMFPGMAKRLEKELLPMSPLDENKRPKWNIKVYAPHYRKYATWAGGSTVAPICPYIDRETFEDIGPQSVEFYLF